MSDFGPPIDARPVFTRDRESLLELVEQFDARDWQQPTACAPWRMREVVAHLVGDDLARLARTRDHYRGDDAPRTGETFAGFIDRLHQRWVAATTGLSPTVLTGLPVHTTPRVLDL